MGLLGQPLCHTPHRILKVSGGGSEILDGTSGGVEKSDSGHVYLEGSTDASPMGAMGVFGV